MTTHASPARHTSTPSLTVAALGRRAWQLALMVFFGGLFLAVLSGCAVPEWQKPGTPEAQIRADMGRPSVTVALPDGGERLVYSRQPAGQQVYHMDFDASKRLVRVDQVLVIEQFQALRNGQDNRESVFQRFGPPALVEHVASFKGDIWTYRFSDNNSPRQAHVHIDPSGVVRRVMFTDEVRNEEFHRR